MLKSALIEEDFGRIKRRKAQISSSPSYSQLLTGSMRKVAFLMILLQLEGLISVQLQAEYRFA